MLLEERNALQSSQAFSTLVELLRYRAQEQPFRSAFIYLKDGEVEEECWTYETLDTKARAIAAHLQSLQITNSRAILLYPPGLDFIAAFFGCLYAGVVAVPAYPPRRNQHLGRLQSIFSDAQSKIALTHSSVLSNIQGRLSESPGLSNLNWVATNTLSDQLADYWKTISLSSSSIAFLQYTSGSTGNPKGVMVSHDNLLHNSSCIQKAFKLSAKSVSVTWLPSFHDMGLIDGILQPIYTGFPCYMMAPIAFVQKPIRWLNAVSKYRANHSGGPNFAFELCIQKTTPEQRADLDLSPWQFAYCGAEPIRPETLETFIDTFVPYGFQHKAFYPCYGMAEATLMVTGGDVSKGPVVRAFEASALQQNRAVKTDENGQNVKYVVSCGYPVSDTQIIIVHPELRVPCAKDEIGEIWIASPSIAQGYWQKIQQTDETFQACLASGEGDFLRTGDLGFIQDDQLFVTGRLKDLVIIRGRNYYPQDLELSAEQSHSITNAGGCAAFSMEVDGEEQLVVVQEVKRHYQASELDDAIASIRGRLVSEHDIYPYGIVLIRTHSIPKTSSGKIQRQACKAALLENHLKVIASSFLKAADLEHQLTEIVKDILEIHQIELSDNFFDLGGSSLKLMQICNKLSQTVDHEISVIDLFNHPNVRSLINYLESGQDSVQSLSKSRERASTRRVMSQSRQAFRQK
ncbi:MAG: AMP-binding protein [Cyanobacteria bacterium P01_H01_bin.21]